jgi:hypothetical protein
MELTEEQKERIRKNRERALELQRQKREEQERQVAARAVVGQSQEGNENSTELRNTKRRRVIECVDEGDTPLEQFEEGASEYVNKTEAMKVYCLPEGTLAVCSYVEKQNPKHKQWVPMKLYLRSEIRRRAHERWGGIEGLMAERQRRETKQFQRDMEKTKDVFKKK